MQNENILFTIAAEQREKKLARMSRNLFAIAAEERRQRTAAPVVVSPLVIDAERRAAAAKAVSLNR